MALDRREVDALTEAAEAAAGPRSGGPRAGGGGGWRGAALRLGLMAVPVAFFAVFFAYPVSAIVGRGLKTDGAWQFGRIGEVLTRPDILDVLWFTTWQALASTALTLLVALPGAYVFARFDFPGKQVLRAVVTVPFVLPTVVVGTAFLALLGRGGLLDELWGLRLDTTVWAILLAHVFFNYAVVVRTVGGLWSQLDPRQEEAARVLGAGRFAAWRRVTLPALAPAVAAATLMVFLFTFTSFGVVQILGGPAYSTLEVEVYRQTAQLLDLPTAAVLTMVQFVAVGAILAVHAVTVRRRERALKLVDPAQTSRRPHGPGQWALLGGVLLTALLLILLPLGVLVERSFDGPGGYGFGYYEALQSAGGSGSTFLVPPLEAVGNSLRYAFVATLIALVVGGLAAAALTRRAGRLVRGFDALLMLPLGVSAVTVGFGFLITLDKPPLDLRTSWILVPLPSASASSSPSTSRRWTCAPPGSWSRWPRRWWASPSSYGPCSRCSARWTTGCARPPPCWGPRRCGPGGRSICRWCGGRCWSRRGSRSPSRSGSSAPPSSSPGPTTRPCRSRSPGCWAAPGS